MVYTLFEWLQPAFMQRAFFAVLLAAPLFGLLGSVVVASRMAFFSDALGHGAFAGVAFGMLLGLKVPIPLATLVFSVIFALVISFVRLRSRASSDTVIGVFASLSAAFGLLILSYFGNFSRYAHALTGDILTISRTDIYALSILFVIVIFVWGRQVNRNFLAQIDEGLAYSYGINPFFTGLIFALLLASLVAFSINWVGVLLLNAMLVLPAASSRLLAPNLRVYHWLSIIFSLASGVLGLIFSYYFNLNTTASIIMVCGAFYLFSLICSSLFLRGSSSGGLTTSSFGNNS